MENQKQEPAGLPKTATAAPGERAKITQERKAAQKGNAGTSGTSGKRGRPKKSQPLDPAFLAALKSAYRQFVGTVQILGDSTKSEKEKKDATTAYVVSAGELLIMKHAAIFSTYAEEVNFAAAAGLWGGYRVKAYYGKAVTGAPGGPTADIMENAGKMAEQLLRDKGILPGPGSDGKPVQEIKR